MKILSFEINNYKCLKHTTLPRCSIFHTFVGRNSSGKTSIFEACKLVKHCLGAFSYNEMKEKVHGGINPYEVKNIELKLGIELPDDNRKQYLLYYFNFLEEPASKLLSTEFLKRIVVTFSIRVRDEKVAAMIMDYHVIVSGIEITDTKGNLVPLIPGVSYDGGLKAASITHKDSKIGEVNADHYLANIPTVSTSMNNLWTDANYFHFQFVKDLQRQMYFIESVRESTKRAGHRYVEDFSDVGERGTGLVNLMDTMFSNYNTRFREIAELCKRIFPDIEDIHPHHLPDGNVRIVVKKKNIPFDIDLMLEGSGIDQLFIIIWQIATSKAGTVWFLDEPELHLHPGAQKLLYDFLRDESKKGKQIFVATHSMVFIHNSELSEISLLVEQQGEAKLVLLDDLISAEEANTQLGRDKIRHQVYQSLGYDPMFAFEPKTVVMVEGPVDESVLTSFSKILEMPVNNRATQFIPVGNKGAIKSFSPVLAYALSGKKSVIVLDNDMERPEDIKNKILSMESDYRQKLKLEHPLLTCASFHLYPEHVYSIEYYLLEAEAICKAFGNTDLSKVEAIRNEINEVLQPGQVGKLRPKAFLKNLCRKHFGSYHKRETPRLIADNVSRIYLERHREIVELVKAITS